jgi:hypothetical protein
MWKEIYAACFKVLSQNLSGRIEENHKKRQVGQLVARPVFEPGISQIQRVLTTVLLYLVPCI